MLGPLVRDMDLDTAANKTNTPAFITFLFGRGREEDKK